MATYTIKNTAGANVAVIGASTTTGSDFPIELIGQGVNPYGPIIAANEYKMLENFANTTAPVNPVTGMFWFDTGAKSPKFYDGAQFVAVSGLTTNNSSLLPMESGATNINMAEADTVPLFTDPNLGDVFYPTSIMLTAVGTPTMTQPAVFNLFVNEAEDVLESMTVFMSKEHQCVTYPIQGTTQGVSDGKSLQMEIVNAAAGNLTVNAYVFGFKV